MPDGFFTELKFTEKSNDQSQVNWIFMKFEVYSLDNYFNVKKVVSLGMEVGEGYGILVSW